MDIQILLQKFYDYSLFIRGYSKDTIKRYRQMIGFYCRYANVTKIEDINEENVRAFFLYGRTERKWASNTYILFHKSLIVFCRWCVENKYMLTNPIDCIEVPKLEKRLPSKLTKQEALKILEVVSNYPYDYKFLRHRNHALFSTLLFAGLRKKELLSLKYGDVDIENLSIFVNQGKGAKDRIVPMSFTLAQSLKKYTEERKRLNKTCPEFFVSLNRNMGFTNMGLRRLVRKIKEASKINFTVHKLRHSFACSLGDRDVGAVKIQKLMGHADIKMTMTYLRSINSEDLREDINKLCI